jgi:hypothetical protein
MNELQRGWVERLWEQFGQSFLDSNLERNRLDPHVAPDGRVRIVLSLVVIVIEQDGRCHFELRGDGPARSWDDEDFSSADPFVRHAAHQAAKGRP